jgi:hypothetical protein
MKLSLEKQMPDLFDHIYPYRGRIDEERYSRGIDEALDLLAHVRNFAPTNYECEHKGVPFYIMGYAALASHDYSAASLYFDAAVAEDIKNFPLIDDKPSLSFMRLDDRGQEMLATRIIREIITNADELIADYNQRVGARNITLDELRSSFLRPIISSPEAHKRTLVTAFISFIAEWKYSTKVIDLIRQGSREPFFMHLFRGCLLFESLLKAQSKKPVTKNTLRQILQHDLFAELGLINVDVQESDFNNIIAGLRPTMEMPATINSVGKARNTLGHNIVWITTDLNVTTYNLLVKNVAAACLHAVSKLYF